MNADLASIRAAIMNRGAARPVKKPESEQK